MALTTTAARHRPAASDAPALPLAAVRSGGQTGADRAALDWALAHGVPHGGWVPRGRVGGGRAVASGVRGQHELRWRASVGFA